MDDHITCPQCGTQIPLSHAITRQISEKYESRLAQQQKQSDEREQKLIAQAKQRIEEEKEKATRAAETLLREKLRKELELEIKNAANESEELKKQKADMQTQLLDLHKTIRALKDASAQKELDLMKTFQQEQDKIRADAQKRAQDMLQLQIMEKDKKLNDVLRMNEELRRKIEQGSQQMQGEVLELALEDFLKKEFPLDRIVPVPKGVNGADLMQIVMTPSGAQCGTILWETKRTKTWSGQWIAKLKSDQRVVHAEIAVIVSSVLPEQISHFGNLQGIWVTQFEFITGVAHALRSQLTELATIKAANQGQQGKTETLYTYITSTAFKQRVEAIVEAFTAMQTEIEKEKRWFTQKWAREETHIRGVIDMTLGMRGELQAITGGQNEEAEEILELEVQSEEIRLL